MHDENLVVAYRNNQEEEIYALTLNLFEIWGLHFLLVFLIVVITTNECERTFSHFNNIFTDDRSNLKVSTVDLLLNVHVNGSDLKHFDSTTPIQDWKILNMIEFFCWRYIFLLKHHKNFLLKY